MVRAINKVEVGPVSGAPLAFAIQTGDNADNCQLNEFRWNIDILDGKTVTPDSGSLTKYEGVADNVDYDVHYWHPDAPPAGKAADIYKTRFGFPQVTGLLDAARKPFTAQGHQDAVVLRLRQPRRARAGQLPAHPAPGLLSTGPLKVTALPPGLSQTDVLTASRPQTPMCCSARWVCQRAARHGRPQAPSSPASRSSPSTSTPAARRSATASPQRTRPRARPTTRSTRAFPRHRARLRQPERLRRGLPRHEADGVAQTTAGQLRRTST